MIRLERNIVDLAKGYLQRLEDYITASDGEQDLSEAKTALSKISTLVELTKQNDTGMSDECAGILEEIERRASAVATRLPDTSGH
ncbi:hypothetical protein [Kushneria phosphatilytica]|uniref:Uncharacterized protein n=1 Tax=Kushneria phosphatilytica TaxID=657387 RepID=A0A1S1P082_9GAMM|nr:hypothetical protein [Kushneria phosphatilytica]OHV11885.1 hypothetical protein BH688_04140 [Kushneria phosphatilytica]QEL11058.1 hypothetical protein FY550_07895 [Kushneria phosphatilytica]